MICNNWLALGFSLTGSSQYLLMFLVITRNWLTQNQNKDKIKLALVPLRGAKVMPRVKYIFQRIILRQINGFISLSIFVFMCFFLTHNFSIYTRIPYFYIFLTYTHGQSFLCAYFYLFNLFTLSIFISILYFIYFSLIYLSIYLSIYH